MEHIWSASHEVPVVWAFHQIQQIALPEKNISLIESYMLAGFHSFYNDSRSLPEHPVQRLPITLWKVKVAPWDLRSTFGNLKPLYPLRPGESTG
jgi:hypothetical protein